VHPMGGNIILPDQGLPERRRQHDELRGSTVCEAFYLFFPPDLPGRFAFGTGFSTPRAVEVYD